MLQNPIDSDAVSSMMADKLGFFSGSEWAGRDSVVHFVGVSGEPVPYNLDNDVFVTATLLACLFIACFVVSRSIYALGLQAKNFFRLRDRSEDFSLKSESEVRGGLFVVLLEGFVLGLLFFSFFTMQPGSPTLSVPPYMLLLANIGIVFVYLVYKYGVLQLFNWTFFSSGDRQAWMRGYNLIAFGKALTMLVLTMVVLYAKLPISLCIYIFLGLLGVFELLVLYKTKQIFFGSIVGLVPAILYFCTLELLPLLFLWVILVQTNVSIKL